VKRALRGLYFVTPEAPTGRLELVAAALRGGACLVQYRDKTSPSAQRLPEARAMQALCRAHDVWFLINDDLELAVAIGADGVHLGATDVSLPEARARLGPDAVLGASCYASLARAEQAVADGADYVAFGAMFPSPTKPQAVPATPGLLRAAKLQLPVAICAIGGITEDNAATVIAAGADMVAVVQGISSSPEPEAAAARIQAAFAREALA